MLKEKYSEFEIAVFKLAKKYEINMVRSCEEEVEFFEEDKLKAFNFADEINKLNPRTRVVELISIRQHIDTRGNDIRLSKSLYLVDDDYYNAIIGDKTNDKNENIYKVNEQVDLFGMWAIWINSERVRVWEVRKSK